VLLAIAMSQRNDESRAERSWLEARLALSQRKGGSRDETERNFVPRAGRTKLQEFFIPGDGIHREVLEKEICRYLGLEANSRPSNYNVRQSLT
jgi:hypothetical protein